MYEYDYQKLMNIRFQTISTKSPPTKSFLSQKSDEMVELMVLCIRKGASGSIARTSTDLDKRAKYCNIEKELAREIEEFKNRAKSR